MQRRTPVLLTLAAAVASVGLVTSPAAAASDKQTAKTGVLVKQDLPSSWESAPPNVESDRELEALAAQLPECDVYLDSREQLDAADANVDSREFTSPDAESFSNEVWVFAKTGPARDAFDAMGAPENAGCLTVLFQELFEQQLAADPASAADIVDLATDIQSTSSVPDNGDDQLGYIGTVTITYVDGSTQQLLLGYFAVRTGRGIIGYTILAPPDGESFSRAYTRAVEGAIADTATRLERAIEKG